MEGTLALLWQEVVNRSRLNRAIETTIRGAFCSAMGALVLAGSLSAAVKFDLSSTGSESEVLLGKAVKAKSFPTLETHWVFAPAFGPKLGPESLLCDVQLKCKDNFVLEVDAIFEFALMNGSEIVHEGVERKATGSLGQALVLLDREQIGELEITQAAVSVRLKGRKRVDDARLRCDSDSKP